MLYSVVLASAVQQHESDICVCVCVCVCVTTFLSLPLNLPKSQFFEPTEELESQGKPGVLNQN